MADQFGVSAKELARNMADFVNSHWFPAREEVATEVLRMHRTLQAGVADLAMQILKVLASLPDNQVDARNEYAVKAARAGYKAMSDALNGAEHISGA